MKHLMRITIILIISLLGEILSVLVPLPVPGSVYGLILMLLALCARIVPLDVVRPSALILLDIMPVMFIPAAVGIISNWEQLKPMLIPVTVIMVVSTFVVMAAAGHATQAVMRRSSARKEEQK